MRKTSKKSNKTTKNTNIYVRIAPGVSKSTASNTYRVRKMVNGIKYYETFTSKTKAIAYYKSLSK